jgi:hypothetical protein
LHFFFAKKKIKPAREVVYESSSISIYKANHANNIAKEMCALGTIDRTEFKNSIYIGSHATIEIYATDELFERLVADIDRLSKNTDGLWDDSVLQFSFNSNDTLIKEKLFDLDNHRHDRSTASAPNIKLTSVRYQFVNHRLPFYFLDRKENTSSEQDRLDRLSEAEFITLRKIQSKYLEWVILSKNIKAINRQKILKQHVQTIDPTIIVLMKDFSLNYLPDKHLITLYKDGSEVTFLLGYDEFMNNSDLFQYVAFKIIQNAIDTLYLKIKEASC